MNSPHAIAVIHPLPTAATPASGPSLALETPVPASSIPTNPRINPATASHLRGTPPLPQPQPQSSNRDPDSRARQSTAHNPTSSPATPQPLLHPPRSPEMFNGSLRPATRALASDPSSHRSDKGPEIPRSTRAADGTKIARAQAGDA